jgi:LacI family transcriptional regulator
MVTVDDVARLAGVSKSTASRALRGHPAINAGTITRVRAAADRLNYVPNHVASSLALQRTNTLVLFVNNLVTRQTDEFHDGIEDVCAERGFVMLLQKLNNDRDRKARYLQLLRQRRVDGVIVVPDTSGVHADEIRQIREWGIAVVQVDNEVAGAGCDYVGCDNRGGARLAAEHLLARGHRRFGIVAGVAPLSCITERVDAFRERLAEQGLTAELRQSGTCEGSAEFARNATHDLLDRVDPPTAIFSVSDPGALGVLRAISERGLRCPEDVAVASFDDDVFAAYLETSLTSVHWPAYEIGRDAAALLIDRIRGDVTGPPQRRLLRPNLIYRESTLGAARPAVGGLAREDTDA